MVSLQAKSPGQFDAHYPLDETIDVNPCVDGEQNVYPAVFLCQSKITGEIDAYSILDRLPPLVLKQNATFHESVKTVQCPHGHFTHSFLATDPQAYCWPFDSDPHVVSKHMLSQTKPTNYSTSETPTAKMSDSFEDQSSFLLPPMFVCDEGDQQVPHSVLCDHRPDCPDASDEDFCVFRACEGGLLPCVDGKQVSAGDTAWRI